MLLARVLVLVAAVLAAPREDTSIREPTNPYRLPHTVKDDEPIHFEDNLPNLKQGKEYIPSTDQNREYQQRPATKPNTHIYNDPQRPIYNDFEINLNNNQRRTETNSQNVQDTYENQKPNINQQKPNINFDTNTYDQSQLNQNPPNYNQYSPNTNGFLSNSYEQKIPQSNENTENNDKTRLNSNNPDFPPNNYDQPKPVYQYSGISPANTSTPLYVREPSRTRPVLKLEEIGYGLENGAVVKYDGAQVWNVDINNDFKLRVVGDLKRNDDISSWGGSHESADFMIKPEKLDRVGSVLRNSGIRFNVVIDDLQRYIDEENPQLTEEELDLQDRKGHRMTWKQYHRVADIHGFLDYLANTYPSLCSVMSIGKSYKGRDLKVLRISNGNPSNKAILIDGGIHAREWISPATVTYIINEIVENYDGESRTFKNLDWYIIPVLNPDGYEYTHTHDRLWRKNRNGTAFCNGVDLNRNFGYKWGGKGTSNNQCSEIYAGTGAFSETESKALQDFVMRSSANFKLYATYHSYGEYILYPWGYDSVVPEDYQDLDRVAKEAAQAIVKAGGNQYKVGASSIVLYPAAGGSDDWAKAIPKIKYTYTIELSDKGQYGFVLPASYITKVAKEALAGLRVMADAAIRA